VLTVAQPSKSERTIMQRKHLTIPTALIMAASALFAPSARAQAQSNAYAQAVLLKGPLAYWRLNETGNPAGGNLTAADASGGGYDGTYDTAALITAGPRPPDFGGFETNHNALQVTAGTDLSWVEAPQPVLNVDTVTFTAWLFPNGDQADWTGILMDRSGDGEGMGIGGGSNHGMLTYTWNNNSSATYGFVSGLTIPQNQWSFVAVVIAPTRATLYLGTGGVLTNSVNAIAHIAEPWGGNAEIGNDICCGSGRIYNGMIDEVAVFNKALSADDIAGLYAARAGQIAPAPLTLVAQTPGPGAANVAPTAPISVRFLNGTNTLDNSSVSIKLDNVAVTATVSSNGNIISFKAQPSAVLAALSAHTVSLNYADMTGKQFNTTWTFTVQNYPTLDSTQIVTPDTTKPGFVFEMSQVDSVGSDTQNSVQRIIDQLAGLLGPNTADPNAQGIASGPGTPNSDPNLPIDFQIPTVINLSASGNTGDFPPGDQMPGAPGTGGGTDNQAARIITYVDLPAGMVTLGVNSDDAFRTAAGAWNDAFTTQILGQFDGGRGIADTLFNFFVPKAGVYPLFTLWENGGGGSDVTWFSVKPDGTKVLLNDSTNGGFKTYRAIIGGTKNIAVGRTVLPAPGATGVNPILNIKVELVDGATPIDKSTVSLQLDNVAVAAAITKSSNVTTIVYAPTNIFASLSSHTATLLYSEAGSQVSRPWQFTIAQYNGYALDSVAGHVGFLLGNAVPTTDAAGSSGKAGDKAIDLGSSGNAWVNISNPSFLNVAASNDVMTFSMWVKKYDIANGSAFWADSPTTGRAFQAHTPWSDDNIYFDTSGCCDGSAQRINAHINTFAGYTGNDGWWTNWHHFVFLKNAADKQIWIDGQQFLDGSSTDPLPTDINGLGLGTDGVPGGDFMHGQLDDFAVFSSALSAANIALLAKGTLPTTLTGEKLMAYWNFDNIITASGAPPPSGPHIDKIAISGTNLTITWTGSGSLQQTTALGPGATWTDVSGATASPATVPIGSNNSLFNRVKM
jgi:hypothetical protein